MRWQDERLWNATADAGPVARSTALDAALAEAGFREIGVLGRERPGFDPKSATVVRVPVWRSDDGVITALAEQARFGPRLVLLTLLQDGTVLRTDGRRRSVDVAAALGEHAAKVEPSPTRPIVLDVRDTGAVWRRSQQLALAPTEWARESFVPLLVPLAAVVALIVVQRLAASPLPVDAAGHLDVAAARRVAVPEAARAGGAALGATAGVALTTLGADGLILLLLVALTVMNTWLPPEAVAPRLIEAGAGPWALAGLVVALAWGFVAVPPLSRRRATPPPAPLPADELLEDYALPPDPGCAPARPRVLEPTVRRLVGAGFAPLGQRVVGDTSTTPRVVATAEVLVSDDGLTIAEVRTVGDEAPYVGLTSVRAFDTWLETRTLPDPGPLPDLVDPKRLAAADDRVVTAASLRRARWWPTLATSRVADRPRVGLRVTHVEDVDEALRVHAERLGAGGSETTPIRDLAGAVAVLEAADRRRVPMRTTADRLPTALPIALVPCLVALIFFVGPEGVQMLQALMLPAIVVGTLTGRARDRRDRVRSFVGAALLLELWMMPFGAVPLSWATIAGGWALVGAVVLAIQLWQRWLPHSGGVIGREAA